MTHQIQKEISEIKDFILNQTIKSKEILSLSEAAIYMNVSKSYLYKLTCKREITFYRPGNKLIFFKRSELDSWMVKNKEPSTQELMSTISPINSIKKNNHGKK